MDEEVLRNPSAGGRNLCRVESIDNLEWRDERRRAGEFLSRCSDEDLIGFKDDVKEGEALVLSRCVSSEWNLTHLGQPASDLSDDSEGPGPVHVPVMTLTA